MEETISFQLLSKQESVNIDRLHICTWEVGSHKPIIEIGLDIEYNERLMHYNSIDFTLYTPWEISQAKDLFSELIIEDNARFIFNESISGKDNVNENSAFGVIHRFSNKTKLCILPLLVSIEGKNVNFSINMNHYLSEERKENIYVRFYIIPDVAKISIQKHGISKSTIIYDTKINEKRNVPISLLDEISRLHYPTIVSCYSFNIVENNMDIAFEDKNLKSVRNLEYSSFKRYFKVLIEDKKIKIENSELLVVFNKNKEEDSTYSFFTIYLKEHFGLKQISIILLLNLICSFLFFLPSFRGKIYNHKDSLWTNFINTPIELIIIFLILLGCAVYITNPKNIFKR